MTNTKGKYTGRRWTWQSNIDDGRDWYATFTKYHTDTDEYDIVVMKETRVLCKWTTNCIKKCLSVKQMVFIDIPNKESTTKIKDGYNITCDICGSPAYQGLLKIECSNCTG